METIKVEDEEIRRIFSSKEHVALAGVHLVWAIMKQLYECMEKKESSRAVIEYNAEEKRVYLYNDYMDFKWEI